MTEQALPPHQARRVKTPVEDLMELTGFVLVVVFSWFVWHPAPLLVSGLVLILTGNARAARRRREGRAPSLVDRVARALAAYRAYRG